MSTAPPPATVDSSPGGRDNTHHDMDVLAPRLTPLQRARRWLREHRPDYAVGTLRYTGFGMIMVFVWLLWGDFCFTLLDQNIPNILPLKLTYLGVGDMTNSFLNGTIAYAVTFFLAPIVSFRSDRTRTRWGRRIPYLLWSTPFVGLFLIAIGCYDSLTNVVMGNASQVSIQFLHHTIVLTRASMLMIVLGAAIVGWNLANIFVNTIYYYLFNDVVPTKYLSRFFALFRIVMSLAGMAYSHWVYGHALDHFRTIFVIAGIAYAVGFFLMCLFIREGEYPPPPQNIDQRTGVLSSIKTYARECFTHRLYWWFFLANACVFSSRLSTMFMGQRNNITLGMSLQQIGDYSFWSIFIGLFLQFPAGWLSDRFHPLRVYMIATILSTFGIIAQCVWIFHDFGPAGNLTYLYITGLCSMPLLLIADAAELPMYMRLLPKDRYGQFASANGMVRAFARIFLSILIGAFIGWMKHWYGDRRFTWIAGWQLFFQLIGIGFLLLLYRQWQLSGGNRDYIPPGTTLESAALNLQAATPTTSV